MGRSKGRMEQDEKPIERIQRKISLRLPSYKNKQRTPKQSKDEKEGHKEHRKAAKAKLHILIPHSTLYPLVTNCNIVRS